MDPKERKRENVKSHAIHRKEKREWKEVKEEKSVKKKKEEEEQTYSRRLYQKSEGDLLE